MINKNYRLKLQDIDIDWVASYKISFKILMGIGDI